MLSYLISTSQNLISVVIVTCLSLSFVKLKNMPKGMVIHLCGIGLGLVLAFIMSYMKNATNRIDTGIWNLRIFSVSLCLFVLFTILSFTPVKKIRIIGVISAVILALLLATLILYALPDVIAYPYTFLETSSSVISTDYLYKTIGYLCGIILAVVAGFSVYKGANKLSLKIVSVLFFLTLLINALRQVTVCLSIMLAKRIIESNHMVFSITVFSSNHSDYFIYLTMAVALAIPMILWARSFSMEKEPWSNPAEHRKIKAKWRSARRWATTAIVCFVLVVLNMTVVKAYDTKVVELSPVEDAADVDDENVYVSFEQVSDGHLHRFAYETEDGTNIRFIVIQKSSSSYGVGLDACDICGETGYYERDGQVVCKLCDVVMNISTIGFKGGCNPIVIDYSISDGMIIVPIEGLLEYESEFK